ncbi:hypothetical protein [Fusobacterium sp. CM22]|uniref:hypothetical protein n=1 Tax=Fusobacterium sp. CM22 TaxID=936563 RepID=UPI000447F128|nr:hypothetical protein [Fusobacterium sp. CM22]EUB14032.1 hypothetical protein HMPREF1500_1154 [Fusobacterium sp. CM22]
MYKKDEVNLKSKEFWNFLEYKNKFATAEYYKHLKTFLDKNDYEKLFRVLKYSDILLKSDKEIKDIEDFILKNYSLKSWNLFLNLKNKKKIKDFFKEIKILKQVYSEISKKIENICKNEFIIFNYINKKLKEINDDLIRKGYTTNKDLDNKESLILILNKFLKEKLKKEGTLKYIENIDFNVLTIYKDYNILQDLYNFDYLTDIWKYSNLKIKNNYFIEIGEFGQNKIISQYLFLKKKEEKAKSSSYYEEFLYSQIKEYFYIEDTSQEYLKIPLKYWIKAHLLLIYDVQNSTNIIKKYHNKDEILKLLTKSVSNKHINKKIKDPKLYNFMSKLLLEPIPREKAEIILNKFIFTQNSKDLYDSPIIEHEKGYIILPQILLGIDFSRALFSIISNSNEGNIEQKGLNLENTVQKMIEKEFSKFEHNKKGKFNRQDYELDFVYKYNDELIFLEIKTQKQPENYYDFYRCVNDLNKYINKFNRNVECCKSNDDKEKKFFKQDYKNIKKIFISNVTYNISSIRDVFIVDEDDFFEFFNKEKNYSFSNLIEKKELKILEIKSNIGSRETIFSQKYNGIKGIINYCIKD